MDDALQHQLNVMGSLYFELNEHVKGERANAPTATPSSSTPVSAPTSWKFLNDMPDNTRKAFLSKFSEFSVSFTKDKESMAQVVTAKVAVFVSIFYAMTIGITLVVCFMFWRIGYLAFKKLYYISWIVLMIGGYLGASGYMEDLIEDAQTSLVSAVNSFDYYQPVVDNLQSIHEPSLSMADVFNRLSKFMSLYESKVKTDSLQGADQEMATLSTIRAFMERQSLFMNDSIQRQTYRDFDKMQLQYIYEFFSGDVKSNYGYPAMIKNYVATYPFTTTETFDNGTPSASAPAPSSSILVGQTTTTADPSQKTTLITYLTEHMALLKNMIFTEGLNKRNLMQIKQNLEFYNFLTYSVQFMRNSLNTLSAQFVSNTLTTIVTGLPAEKLPENPRKVVANILTTLMFLRDDLNNQQIASNVASGTNVTVSKQFVSLELFSKMIDDATDSTLRKLNGEIKTIEDLMNRSKKPMADNYAHTFVKEDKVTTSYTIIYVTVAVSALFALVQYLKDTVYAENIDE